MIAPSDNDYFATTGMKPVTDNEFIQLMVGIMKLLRRHPGQSSAALVAAPNPDHVYHQPEAQRLHSHQRARRPAEYPIRCKRRKRGIFAGEGTTRGRRTAMESVDDLFKGRHFDREIIILCVRWYLRFKLSFRDLVEMMAERGLSLAYTTIMERR